MNISPKNCQKYTFTFPNPSSIRDVFFAPREVVWSDGTIAERIQRWLIDNGDFCTRYGNSLSSRQTKSPFILDKYLCEAFDHNMLVQSQAGAVLYFIMTSMTLRFLELASQSIKNSLNFADFSSKTKTLVNLFTMPAIVGFTLCLGYAWKDILIFMILPILLERVLSFKYSNYFKEILVLSSTKNFVLRNFISKNIQAAFIRILPLIFLLIYRPDRLTYEKIPGGLTLCESRLNDFTKQFYIPDFSFTRATTTPMELLLEPLGLILGKIIFDLAYILILKTVSKDADLRDPMGWMFSYFRKQQPSLNAKMAAIEDVTYPSKRKTYKSSGFNEQVTTPTQTESFSTESPNLQSNKSFNETKDYTTENEKLKYNKIKTRTKRQDDINPTIKTCTTQKSQKTITAVNIEVGGWVRTFQRIENSAFKKETWAVIIADSVEEQKLNIFKKSLSNGSKESIRPLTVKNCYEIGPKNIDPRLIGKIYNAGVYQTLQNFMRMEDALVISQELDRHKIEDDVSLIVFSKLAKKHDNIDPVARSL